MSDLIERLRKWGNSFGLAQHYLGTKSAREDCAEAATALAEAQATIARQQVMLDRALEASFDDKARADRAEAENARLRDFWVAWAHKRLEVQRKHYLRDAKLALNGDMRALRNRVEMMEAEPMPIVPSAALSGPHATKGESG